MKKTIARPRSSACLRVSGAGGAPPNVLVAALVLGAWSFGCSPSEGTAGSGNSGGTVAVQGTGGAQFGGGGAAGLGSGGASASGGANSAGAIGSATGGSQGGGGGSSGGSGGVGGATGPVGTGGSGNGGAIAHAGNGGGGAKAGGAGGKGGAAGAAAGGSKATGGASGGKGGAGGSATAGQGGSAGAGTAGAGGAGGAVSSATLLVELGNAFCAAARTCCAQKSLPTTLGDCETKFPSRLWGLPYFNKGTVTIDNAALAACIAGYKQTSSTCAFQPLEAACKGVFVGTKAPGAACGKGGVPSTSGANECKAGGRVTQCLWTGDSNLSTTTGVCQSPPARGNLGDPCATTCRKNESCVFDLFTSPGYPTATCLEEDGLYCSSATSEPVCASIVPTGGSCAAESTACASTDYCDQTGATPKCRKAATLGQACSSSGPECASGMSLFCGTSSKCEDLGFAYETTCGGTPPFPL